MNNQEIFNTVALHLVQQNKQSTDIKLLIKLRCMYRSPDGLSCAIGCLIPDDKYRADMEGLAVDELAKHFDLGFATGNMPLLRHLQALHDLRKPGKWKKGLREIARTFTLALPAEAAR